MEEPGNEATVASREVILSTNCPVSQLHLHRRKVTGIYHCCPSKQHAIM